MEKNEQKTRANSVSLIRHLSNELTKHKNKLLAELGLTAAQADVILFLLEHPDGEEVNQLDIQSYLCLTNPTVSGILSRLEEKGFIQRTRSSRDARFKRIVLTQQGFDTKDMLFSLSTNTDQLLTNGMDEEEKNALSDLLERALANIDSHDEATLPPFRLDTRM